MEDPGPQLEAIELGRAITLAATQMNVANHRLLGMIADFDRCGGWRQLGAMRSCAHWLAAHCGITLSAAREKVRVARQLQALPEVDAAFSAGELSYSKIRAITRVARPENERLMLRLARHNSAGHLEKLLSRFEPVPEPGLECFVDLDAEGLEQGPLAGQGSSLQCGGCSEQGAQAGVGAFSEGAAHAQSGELSAQNASSKCGLFSEGSVDLLEGVPAGRSTGSTRRATCERSPAGEGQSTATLDPEIARELSRELYWFQDKDGMWVIHARLPPEQGQLVMKALQAVARPLEEQRQEEWKARKQARMQAVARRLLQRSKEAGMLAGSLTKDAGRPVQPGPAVDGVDALEPETTSPGGAAGAVTTAALRDPQHCQEMTPNSAVVPGHLAYARAEEKVSAESFSQHMKQIRADALVAMVEHFLASGPDQEGLQGLKGAERCQVVMHVDINTLREQRSGVCCTHGRAHFEDRPWLSPTTARRLSCDASLVTVLEDEAGKVLNVGRRSRIVPAPIRRALRERDGVCQYPGCHESEYVDAHHIQHWADGGETRLDNLVTLCRFHHRQLHRGLFDIRLEDGSAEVLWKPDCESLASAGGAEGNESG